MTEAVIVALAVLFAAVTALVVVTKRQGREIELQREFKHRTGNLVVRHDERLCQLEERGGGSARPDSEVVWERRPQA